jgi:hypothetical protein
MYPRRNAVSIDHEIYSVMTTVTATKMTATVTKMSAPMAAMITAAISATVTIRYVGIAGRATASIITTGMIPVMAAAMMTPEVTPTVTVPAMLRTSTRCKYAGSKQHCSKHQPTHFYSPLLIHKLWICTGEAYGRAKIWRATRDANQDEFVAYFLPTDGIGLPFSLQRGDFGTSPLFRQQLDLGWRTLKRNGGPIKNDCETTSAA